MNSGDLNFNVYKNNMGRYVIVCLLAGFLKENIDIQIIGKHLHVTVKRTVIKEIFKNGTEGIKKVEGKIKLDGVFKGHVKLPFDINETSVKSKFKNGILTIEISDSIDIA